MKKFFALNKKSFLWSVSIFAVVVFAILLVWTLDFYPVAFVNYRPIMAYSYLKSLDIAKKYYGTTINMSDAGNLKTLQQAVLQGLIDEVAIDGRLRQDMTAKEEQNKIDQQIQVLISDPGVVKGLSQHNISVSDATEYFFPIAIKNEILSGQLALENKQLMPWLVDARKNLKVVILMPHAHWTDNSVQFD